MRPDLEGPRLDYTAVIVLACILIPLERLFPLHSEQPILRRNWWNDVIYVLVNGIVVRVLSTLVLGALMLAYREFVPLEDTSWVRTLPIWVQVIAVIVIADIGYYTAHRTAHAVPFLWRFHAVHHSIEEMDWLATHRVHPIDQLFTNTLSLLPIYCLGFSGGAVGIFIVVYHVQALLIHSNTRLRFGPLKWLFASPEYHHWHHANQREAYDRNFASQLSFLDAIGGTLYLPADRTPDKYGLDEKMPDHYHQQLLYPFAANWKAWQRKRQAIGTTHEQET
jgi:sterol desaturase/sphingolipid hydroxylase (fatty acid hydroxylase superfamily)